MVWYAGYGSNLCAARFRCYLEGGTPPGLTRRCRGARDKTPPHDDRPVTIPHSLYFAGTSGWGGAPSFVDTVESTSTPTHGRAYLIAWEQFEDVVAQENERSTTTPIGLAPDDLTAGFSVGLGPGRYENLLCLGRLEGFPVVTFTSPGAMTEAQLGEPAPAYLKMLVAGLREAYEMRDDALIAYLGAAPGCSEALVTSVLAPEKGDEIEA
jgi:hypothetical protein